MCDLIICRGHIIVKLLGLEELLKKQLRSAGRDGCQMQRIDFTIGSEPFRVRFLPGKPFSTACWKSAGLNHDGFVKSRHPGENRGPLLFSLIEMTGYPRIGVRGMLHSPV
jgi:hypothetical protein